MLNRMQATAKAHSQTLLAQAKKKLLDKDYKGSITLLTEAIQLDGANTDAKFFRALSHLDQGMNREAGAEFRELIDQESNNSQASFILLSIA
jgi:cytochrome c-type biogenesis protein CcmH/NrfG